MRTPLFATGRRLALALALTVASPVWAQANCLVDRQGQTHCTTEDTRCVKNRYGDWLCSAPGGDARLNRYGDPVCAQGHCVKDAQGEWKCSSQPRGAAALDLNQQPVCAGSCEPAQPALCSRLGG